MPPDHTTNAAMAITTISTMPMTPPMRIIENCINQSSRPTASAVRKPMANARHCVSPSPARVSAPKSIDL